MLDIAFIRHNVDSVRAAIKNKRCSLDLDELLAADVMRRETVAKVEKTRARKNEIASLISKASKDDRPKLIEDGKAVKAELESLEPALQESEARFAALMLQVPSLPRPEVPTGVGEEDNVEIRKVGTIRAFDFTPKDHVELMTGLKMVNTDKWEALFGLKQRQPEDELTGEDVIPGFRCLVGDFFKPLDLLAKPPAV